MQVGSKSSPDQAIIIYVMKLPIANMEAATKSKGSMLEMGDLTKKGVYFMSFVVYSLRKSEGFMMNASGLWHHIGKVIEGTLDHVVITFMGRFKGETMSRHHLQAVVNEKVSKLNVRWWLERLNNKFINKVQRNCPVCCYKEGNLDKAWQYQDKFVHFLTEIQQERSDIISGCVNVGEDFGIRPVPNHHVHFSTYTLTLGKYVMGTQTSQPIFELF